MHLLRLWPTLGMLNLALVAWSSSAGTDLSRKVLIVGIDGTMPSALAVAATPHLDRLMSNGCHSVRVVSHPVTHSATDFGPASRGNQFFLGGAGDGFIYQRIAISNLAVDVDRGGVGFTLAGWFGGMGAEEDNAWLTAWFLDEAGAVLGSNEVGRVTAAHRVGQTGLLERTTSGGLPPGTRFVDFILTLEGGASPNKTLADNLSLGLHAPTAESLSLVAYGFSETGWQVEFLSRVDRDYVLERSGNLEDWTERTSARTGTGSLLVLIDEAPPAGNAFYRVVSRPSP